LSGLSNPSLFLDVDGIYVHKEPIAGCVIIERKTFTLSVPSQKQAAIADYFDMASGRKENKFEKAGITPVKAALVNASYPEEFPMVLECELMQNHELGLHTLVVGKILDVKVDEAVLNEKGEPEINKVDPFVFTPFSGGYYCIGDFVGKGFSIGRDL
jgi:flavin reductase (DIM6/NTAB) family NADH-FMN oxidoreductase RutF